MKPYTFGGDTSTTTSITIDPNYNHLVAGLTIYTDDTKTTIATATTGNVALEGRVAGTQGWNSLDGSPVDVSDDSSYVSTSIPLVEVRAVPDSIVGDASYYEVVITANSH